MGHMGAAMGHACAHTWAIYGSIHGSHGSSNGACMRAYMGHIWGLQWGMHACIYGLYIANAKRLVQIRYKAWRFLIAFLIVLIFVPLNGAYMRAHIGHIWGHI